MSNPIKKATFTPLGDALSLAVPAYEGPRTRMVHGETVPVDELLPKPARYFLIVKQVGVKEKIGSIYMPDSAKDAQSYTHGLAIVLRMGPATFKGRKFEDMGLGADEAPKVGDIVQFQARSVPAKFRVCDIDLMAIPDDSYYATVEPHQIPFISFAL